MKQTFTVTVYEARPGVTGFNIPKSVIEAFNAGKRPAVRVTVAGYTYLSTVGVYGEDFLIPLSKENREAAGVVANQEVELTLKLDTAPRVIEIPEDLHAALIMHNALEAFETLAPSKRKEAVRQVTDAKAAETRQRRIATIVTSLS